MTGMFIHTSQEVRDISIRPSLFDFCRTATDNYKYFFHKMSASTSLGHNKLLSVALFLLQTVQNPRILSCHS